MLVVLGFLLLVDSEVLLLLVDFEVLLDVLLLVVCILYIIHCRL